MIPTITHKEGCGVPLEILRMRREGKQIIHYVECTTCHAKEDIELKPYVGKRQ